MRGPRRAFPFGAAALLALSAGACAGSDGSTDAGRRPAAGAPTYAVGGTVSGMVGTGLVLENGGSDPLPVAGNGPFEFATRLADGAAYSVTARTQPGAPPQTCSVRDGTGVIASADVSNVQVECATDGFIVGGTVSGLAGGAVLVLRNNGGDDLAVSAPGPFSFPTRIASGGTFDVTVLAQPPAHACTVSGGGGTVGTQDVTSVAVACAQLGVDPARLVFHASEGGAPQQQVITVTNPGTGVARWTATSTEPWLSLEPSAGDTTAEANRVTVTARLAGLSAGAHDARIELALEGGTGATVPVTGRVCGGTCVFADAGSVSHRVEPHLFGDQVNWSFNGVRIWDGPIVASCTTPGLAPATVRADVLAELGRLGVTLLRYPGGTPADFFHWSEAMGPIAGRVPQIEPFGSTSTALARQCPLVGPDELSSFAASLGADIMITANAGTGTAAEAAGWLSHYQQRGVTATYWEIGNEVYLPGRAPTPSDSYSQAAAYRTPEQYAAQFDEYARALRAVDPSVKIGLIGSGAPADWNEKVITLTAEPFDFFAVHNSYAPIACSDATLPEAELFRALLSAPLVFDWSFQQLADQLAALGDDAERQAPIAVTEHGPFFVPCNRPDDAAQVARNRTLGAALFSARSYHVFVRNPQVGIVNHMNMIEPIFQAALNTSTTDGFSCPVRSAFFHVFQAYAHSAGAAVATSTLLGSPVYDNPEYGVTPRLEGVPALDVLSVVPAGGPERLWIYVVNADLTRDIPARVAVDGLPGGPVTTVLVDLLSGPDFTSSNVAGSDARACADALSPVTFDSVAFEVSDDFDATFPKHSLVRLRIP